MALTLEPVAYEDKPVLARLLQLYLYDFSEFLPHQLNAHGEFDYRYLDHYWAPAPGEERHPFFIRADGRLAGFALVRVVNHVNVMAEFFVMRGQRRQGVGEQAAKAVFQALPGRWLVNEVKANVPAQAFWRRVIEDSTGGRFDEEEHEDRVTQRFEI